MSLVLTRITSTFTRPLSSLTPMSGSISTTRTYWRDALRVSRDPENPSLMKYEDPDFLAVRAGRAQTAEGLHKRKKRYLFYEKPWMKRKKRKMGRKYGAMKSVINNLTGYVHYINDAKKALK